MHIRRSSLKLALHPGRWIVGAMKARYYKAHHNQFRFPKLSFALELLMVGIGIGAALSFFVVYFFGVPSVTRQLTFTAAIAPTEVQSGSPSTLVLSWKNGSKQALKNATLALTYPDHFLEQDLEFQNAHMENQRVLIGTIPSEGTGSIKIRGVMFGDVGGIQRFASTLEATYGPKNRPIKKSSLHDFSPKTSALTMTSVFPETIVSGQQVEGTLHIQNTSSIDFGEISMKPTTTDLNLHAKGSGIREVTRDATTLWVLPSLKAGATASIQITGIAPTVDVERTESWNFETHFFFENTLYRQGTSEHTFRLVPAPVAITQSIDTTALTPGGSASLVVTLTGHSEEPLSNIRVFIEAVSPFFAERDGEQTTFVKSERVWDLDRPTTTLESGSEEVLRGTIPLRGSIPQSAVASYDRFVGTLRTGVQFKIPSSGITGTVYSQPITLPITSPVTLNAFGRYATEEGDQLGRGPLPPSVGEETRYFVFWNVSGTINALEDVEIRGSLPPYARFTGKQTVSVNNQVTTDGGELVWHIGRLEPTFAPGSKVAGAAFEIGITPNEQQVGQSLLILDRSTFTARDAVTGAIVQGFGARVTTDLPKDVMAKGLGRVE